MQVAREDSPSQSRAFLVTGKKIQAASKLVQLQTAHERVPGTCSPCLLTLAAFARQVTHHMGPESVDCEEV